MLQTVLRRSAGRRFYVVLNKPAGSVGMCMVDTILNLSHTHTLIHCTHIARFVATSSPVVVEWWWWCGDRLDSASLCAMRRAHSLRQAFRTTDQTPKWLVVVEVVVVVVLLLHDSINVKVHRTTERPNGNVPPNFAAITQRFMTMMFVTKRSNAPRG